MDLSVECEAMQHANKVSKPPKESALSGVLFWAFTYSKIFLETLSRLLNRKTL